MASNWTVCGVCDYRNINKASVSWCSECDEGLCDECKDHHGASKSTRNHATISITEYQKLPPNVLSITQTCQKHKEQYQTFCKKHDCPCCRRCVIETHNECKDLNAIDDIVNDIKSSNAFLEVEHSLAEMLENVRRIREDRTENLKCLQDQRVKIEHDINQTRKKINDHLDKIQDKIMKELYANEENESKKINQFLSEIKDIEKGISNLQVNQNNIRQHASDLQTFLALKHIEKEVSAKEECFQSVLDGEDIKIKTLSLVINKEVQNICRAASFGSVGVESKSCKVVIDRNKNKGAQMIIPILMSKCIDDIKLSNKKRINLQSTGTVRGCAILSNGRMMFCDYENRKIIALNSNGAYDFEIALDTKPCDIAYIENENTIAVTSGSNATVIQIIDPNIKKITRSIKTGSSACGITYTPNKNVLFYSKDNKGIMEIQLNGEPERTLASLDMPMFSYVAVHGDTVCYTDKSNNSVTCYDIHGNIKWTFKDKIDLDYTQGISVDSHGNLYVVGRASHSVVVISPDGKHHRKLLSASDGLYCPRAVHLERKTNKLLVANEQKCAFLYDIS